MNYIIGKKYKDILFALGFADMRLAHLALLHYPILLYSSSSKVVKNQ